MAIDQDAHWKYLITILFEDFVKFFLPKLYDAIDFSIPPVFLEKELDKINKDASKKGHKRCDKLVKVAKKDGTEQWILIHIEVQGGYDKHFSQRMFTYYSRIFDLYAEDIVAVAIFTGNRLPPKPINQYLRQVSNTKLLYQYDTYVVKYQNTIEKEQLLIEDDNPFALVILACLYLLKTKVRKEEKETGKEQIKQQKRLQFKLKLLELAKARGYSRNKAFSLLIFIKYVVGLSPELEEIAEKRYEKLTNLNIMDNLVEQRSQAFFDKYILPQYLEIIRKDEAEKVTIKVTEEVTEKVTEKVTIKVTEEITEKVTEEVTTRLEARRLKEQEQTMLTLYVQMNFTVSQIAVVIQQEESDIIKALKKHNVYKLDK